MNDLLTILGKYLIGPAVIFGIFAFIAKAIVNRYLDKRIELYREGLKRETIEFQTKLVQLQADRVNVIRELYSSLSDVSHQISYTIAALGKLLHQEIDYGMAKAVHQDLHRQIGQLIENYDKKKIYFKRALADKLDLIVRQLALITGVMKGLVDASGNIDNPDAIIEKAISESKKAIPDLNKLVEELEDEFRILLGVQTVT